MAEPVGLDLSAARQRRLYQAVSARVLAELDELVAQMGEAYRTEIPEYADMPAGLFAEEVLPISRRAVQVFLASVLEDRPINTRELKPFDLSGRSRLDMGVPLESVLHAYRIAGRVTWSAVVRAVRPGEEAVLASMAARWMDFIDSASSTVARSYMTASADRLRGIDSRRRELIEALLDATDAAEVAAVSLRFSVHLASAYVPVLVTGGGASTLIDALLQAAPANTIGGHRTGPLGDTVVLLVPDTLPVAAVAAVADGALVTWGRAAAPGPALVAELRHVEHLAETARAGGRGSGCFGPDDLLLEQLLMGNERVARVLHRRVADLLAVRDPSGTLADTARCYLATGSVPETAKSMIVHANTVGYRLGRVRDITGLDPRVPQDAALLILGLGLPGTSRKETS